MWIYESDLALKNKTKKKHCDCSWVVTLWHVNLACAWKDLGVLKDIARFSGGKVLDLMARRFEMASFCFVFFLLVLSLLNVSFVCWISCFSLFAVPVCWWLTLGWWMFIATVAPAVCFFGCLCFCVATVNLPLPRSDDSTSVTPYILPISSFLLFFLIHRHLPHCFHRFVISLLIAVLLVSSGRVQIVGCVWGGGSFMKNRRKK